MQGHCAGTHQGGGGAGLKVGHTAGPPHLRPGERIGIGFAVEDCRALDQA